MPHLPDWLDAAHAHLLQSDPAVMGVLIQRHSPCSLSYRGAEHAFASLSQSIVSQQLSTKAASTIFSRFVALLGQQLEPARVLGLSVEQMRGAGLSANKSRALLGLAERFADGCFDASTWPAMDDEELISLISSAPGIGRWTAQMFLIFGLGRPNVCAPADAGLAKACRLLAGENAQLEQLAQRWQPYTSLASWYLWRHLSDPRPLHI